MARAIDPRKPFDYILKADRELMVDKDGNPTDFVPTVFKLRALLPSEDAAIADKASFATGVGTDDQKVGVRSGTVAYDTLRLGLQGWEHFMGSDDDGNDIEIEFVGKTISNTRGKRIEATEDDIAQIDPRDRGELIDAIASAGRLTAEETGKS